MTTTTETTTATTTAAVDGADLTRALKNAALFTSSDKALPVLNHVQLTIGDGQVTVEATNRYALVKASVTAQVNGPSVTVYLHRDDVKKIAGLKYRGLIAVEASATDGTGGRLKVAGFEVATDDYAFPPTGQLWDGAEKNQETAEPVSKIGFSALILSILSKVDDGLNYRGPSVGASMFFTMTSPLQPVVVRWAESSGVTALVMPVRA